MIRWIVIFTLFWGAAWADERLQDAGELLCNNMSLLAKNVMENRQSGTPMREAMAIVPEDEGAELVRGIVLSAYERPRYHTESNIQRAIEDFENDVYLDCYRTFVAGSDGRG